MAVHIPFLKDKAIKSIGLVYEPEKKGVVKMKFTQPVALFLPSPNAFSQKKHAVSK